MKTLANLIWVSIVMVCVSISFIACDKGEYGDGETWVKPTPAKNDTITVQDTVTVVKTDTVSVTPTPDPSTPDTTKIDWSAQMEKSFGYVKQTNLWPSTITIHLTNGKTEDYGCYLPMETRVEAPEEVMAASDAPASRYTGMEPAKKDSTSWVQEADGYFYRTVTRRQVIHMTNYDATIVSSHKEAYMIKEGRVIYFLHGNEDQPSRYDDTPTTGEDVQRNGKTYTVENAIITMQHHLHGLVTLYPSAKTRVLREKVEEQEEEVTPTPDAPTADYEIPGLQKFMSASRVWNEDEKHYCDVYTFECSESYFFVVVNFTYNKKDDKEKQTGVVTKSIAKSGVYYNAKYASEAQGCAVYDHGTYIPGIYSFDDTGFTVVGGRSNGEKVSQTVFDTDAVNRGIKNMKKENNAKPTPIIYQRSCTVGNNGVWTIIGKTSGHTVTFTVKSK